MIQLQIFSGKMAGHLWEARRFPVRVGRLEASDFRLEDDGVWNEHFQISSNPESGFTLTANPNAVVAVNQAPVQSVHLRNGDIITAGAVKISFRLSETRQRSLRMREAFVWMLIAGVSVGQVALISWLLR